MQSGMINIVAITCANVRDGKGFKHVCPRNSIVYGDKAFCKNQFEAFMEAMVFNLKRPVVLENQPGVLSLT